jgi:hypothetical protein
VINKDALTIMLPRIVAVSDYHQFGGIARIINSMVYSRIKVKQTEVMGYADDNGNYLAMVYIGRKPSQKDFKALAEMQGIKLVRI